MASPIKAERAKSVTGKTIDDGFAFTSVRRVSF